jgi:tripartite-type tricarboxylate transporter receptor subunit TctC
MGKKRAGLFCIGVFSFFLAWEMPAAAAEFPVKPVTFILPMPPGGATDTAVRPLVNEAKKYLGQPIIVENKPGGGNTIGVQIVASKPPDGYTIGVMQRSTLIALHMGRLNFNPVDEATHIMNFSGLLMGIAVRADAPWKTIQEFIEHARKNPGSINYGTPGTGTTAHLPVEELAMDAGVKLNHVPYNGDAGCIPAILGGHVDAISATSGAWGPLLRAGKVRVLCIYYDRRSPNFPNVPTLKESGYNVVETCPIEIFGPKGIPKPIVEKIHDSFKKALDAPDFLAVLKNLDMPVLYTDPTESENFVRRDSEKYKKLVQKLGLEKKQ